MTAALRELPGNPSSVHAAGRAARAAIEAARAEVGALVGAAPETIVFTSGGTEGNDLAIVGLLRGAGLLRGRAPVAARPHVVSSPLEHPSVLGALGGHAWGSAGWPGVALLAGGLVVVVGLLAVVLRHTPSLLPDAT